MSLQEIEQRAAEAATVQRQADAAHNTLRAVCIAAIEAGIPLARVARTAGVTRTTMYSWQRDAAS